MEGNGGSSFLTQPLDGAYSISDTGGIEIRMEDGAEPYLAAIDMTSRHGGLYLENAMERKRITAGTRRPSVSRAAFDAVNLAFAWSAPGETWRIEWQKGLDPTTRGQLTVARTGDSNHYKGFLMSPKATLRRLRIRGTLPIWHSPTEDFLSCTTVLRRGSTIIRRPFTKVLCPEELIIPF
jgi:hypothetical protein